MNPITGVMWHLNCWNCTFSKHWLKVKHVQVETEMFKNQFKLMLCTRVPHEIKTVIFQVLKCPLACKSLCTYIHQEFINVDGGWKEEGEGGQDEECAI